MKRVNIIFIIILSVLISYYNVLSQNRYDNNKFANDIVITVLNSSYVEFIYYPKYINNYIAENTFPELVKQGYPDLTIRSIPIFLPSLSNNRLEILDFNYNEINNIEINPIPTIKKTKDGLYDYDFVKDEKLYNTNEFYPKNFAEFTQNGILRNKYIGHIKIYPAIYNPFLKVVRKLEFIKVRITFGDSPVLMTKSFSKEEKDFFSDLAINSKIAIYWSTKEFNQDSRKQIQNSVLASGDFYKIEVKETGMYKIDKAYLQNAGINTDNINPLTIKMYNNGGKELPYNNSASVIDDLNEIDIYVQTDANGKFDYLLFYGVSTFDWRYDSIEKRYKSTIHHYTNSNIYWLTYGGSNGKRMQVLNSPNIPTAQVMPFAYNRFFEKAEIINLGHTGTQWVSQNLSYNECLSFVKNLVGYVDGSNISLKMRFGNSSSVTAYFNLKDDNSNYNQIYEVSGIFSEFSHWVPKTIEEEYSLLPGYNSISLKLCLPAQYNTQGVKGNYDYYEVHYKRNLNSVQNNSIQFFTPDTTQLVEYQVSPFNSSSVKLFDVTSYSEVKLLNPISFSNGVVKFQQNLIEGSPKRFFIIGDNNYKTPVSISAKVPNQNLHGTTTGASNIIISPTEFLSAANRLKEQREKEGINKINTLVIDINQIYNEFSGGLLDPVAIRNFLKYAFNNWNERPLYVLFFGDGNYDYKNIYNLSIKNYLPPLEKDDPEQNEITSYPSDDFLTDINENFEFPSPCRPDFSHARLCINSLAEANSIVDKIIEYESPTTNGIWKKKIMYVADDGWTTRSTQGEEGSIHTDQCELVAEVYTKKDFEKDKIYIVTYPAVITPQGRRKPGANVDIIKGWNEGRLLINYVGHGSTDLWAHEHIFVRDEGVAQLKNKGKYPIMTIASCDISRWDDPYLISMGEQLVYIAKKGVISSVGSVRPVFSTPNAILNNTLWGNFMFVKDTLNLPLRFGKSLFLTKNQLPFISDNDMKFCIIGDPAMRISIPQFFTKIDSINNTPTSDTAHIKALQRVKVSGSILKPDSTLWNNFNGTIQLKVFDVDREVDFVDFVIYHFRFKLDGGIIYTGKTQVTNGKWSVEFIVPKDISYKKGTGKILAYFYDNINEGSGYSNMFVIDGIDSTAAPDTTGPQISLFMDSRNFRSGDIINQNSKIIADFFDESGINLTGTIGHKIEAIFNNDESNKIDLTNYYTSVSGFQYGTIEYPLENLSEGKYKLRVKAWDTYNNPNETEIEFTVKGTSSLYVADIYNYPNPFKDNTSFIFKHNLDSPIDVEIKIYTVSGKLIKEIKRNNINEKFVQIEWDGKDSDGDAIANGVYLYKLIIKALDGNFTNSSIHKLAKLK